MRIVFGALGLLIVVAIVGILAKNQLTSAPRATGAAGSGVAAPAGTPKQQVDQVKQSVENALQQARPVDDTK
jgi:hypothetical protein